VFEIGKIYNFVNGKVDTGFGIIPVDSEPVESLEKANEYFVAKFIELKE
jgi:hypothetical protein